MRLAVGRPTGLSSLGAALSLAPSATAMRHAMRRAAAFSRLQAALLLTLRPLAPHSSRLRPFVGFVVDKVKGCRYQQGALQVGFITRIVNSRTFTMCGAPDYTAR